MMGKENLPSVKSSQKLLFSVYCTGNGCGTSVGVASHLARAHLLGAQVGVVIPYLEE